MAGSNPAFDPANFRTQIKATMQMGSPTATQDRATFRWVPTKTFARQDTNNRPYSWTSTPVTTDAPADVQVDCAVEFKTDLTPSYTAMGQIENTRIVLTLLDEDYDQIATATHVLLGQNTYIIEYTAPPIGLFEVTVYQMYGRSEDES